MENTKKRVYCLYRVSTLGQVEKDDIPMQKQCCREFAEKQGWEIANELSEKGVSGFKVATKDRDAIQEIQKDAALGKFDILLVFMFDRLGRRDDETPFVVEWFVKNGIEVWSTQEGQQRFDNHVDKLMNYIRYWQASGESIKTSIRTKTRLSQIVQEGYFRGGIAPFGYRLVKNGRLNKKGQPLNDIEIDEYESTIVKLIFNKYLLDGYGSQRLASFLMEEKIRNRKGNNFTNCTIQHMLKNIAYTGVLRSGETISKIFPHLQIIDPKTFQDANKMLTERSNAYADRTVPYQTKGVGLLSGQVYCGHCGARLVQTMSYKGRKLKNGETRDDVRHRYVCYNKTRHKHLCDGQTGYTTGKLDNIIEEILQKFFSKFRESPQISVVNGQYEQRVAECKANLARSKAALEKHTKELAEYKAEFIKTIRGTSVLDADILNELVAESKANVQTASADVDAFRTQLDNCNSMLQEIHEKYDALLSWSDMYAISNLEAKKMLISKIISGIKVSRDYAIDIDFNLDITQYSMGVL